MDGDGWVDVPEGPGLGVEVDRERIEALTVQGEDAEGIRSEAGASRVSFRRPAGTPAHPVWGLAVPRAGGGRRRTQCGASRFQRPAGTPAHPVWGPRGSKGRWGTPAQPVCGFAVLQAPAAVDGHGVAGHEHVALDQGDDRVRRRSRESRRPGSGAPALTRC